MRNGSALHSMTHQPQQQQKQQQQDLGNHGPCKLHTYASRLLPSRHDPARSVFQVVLGCVYTRTSVCPGSTYLMTVRLCTPNLVRPVMRLQVVGLASS